MNSGHSLVQMFQVTVGSMKCAIFGDHGRRRDTGTPTNEIACPS
jgi:hypothetical protein